MNQPSMFQTQYPLSPKKFWKKILPNLITYFILSALLGLGIGALVFFGSGGSSGAGYIGTAFVCILIIYAILISLNAWYIKTYINRYYYDCGDQFVTIKKGVFTPTEIHVQYPKIQDVYVDQDFIDRLMGLYDVHIASATVTSGIEAHIDGVEQVVAEAIKNFLLAKIQGGSMPSAVSTPGQSAGMAPSAPMPPSRAASFQSATKVSSETFPVSGAWTVSAIIGAFFYSLGLTLIFGSWIGRLAADVFLSSAASSPEAGSILGFAFLLFFIIFFGRIVWVLLWKSSYYFEFLPDYILLRTGVISRSENHLPYKSIQNVTNKQGIIERILGIATVSVENAAFVTTAQKSFSLSGGSSGSRSAGVALIGQPKEKADQLNQILNQITSAQGNVSVSMGV